MNRKKNEEADHLIKVVGIETQNVSQEKTSADEEKIKVDQINIDVRAKQIDCEQDLKKAEPALIAAQEALNTLNKVDLPTYLLFRVSIHKILFPFCVQANLTELKSFGSPPSAVLMVTSAVMVLVQGIGGKVPKDR